MNNNLKSVIVDSFSVIEKLITNLKDKNLSAIAGLVNDVLHSNYEESVVLEIIDKLEVYMFDSKDYYLSKYLFLLNDKVQNEYMARFYLQYCYEELLNQSAYLAVVNKYLSLLPKNICGNYLQYDGEFNYVYEESEKKYSVHSFSNDIGHNLTLLTTPYGSIILDCGAKCISNDQAYIDKTDLSNFLKVYGVAPKDIVGVLISHAHLDHYGSVLSLAEIGIPPTKFYADERTIEIIRDATGEKFLDSARPISSFFVANQKIKIHSYDNGHILGSQLFVIRFDDKTIVYTGDFCLHNQHTVVGLNVPNLLQDDFVAAGVDCLITESTYGSKVSDILPYKHAEKALLYLIDKLIKHKYKIFLPAFAVGRSQELALMLSEHHKLLIDGLSVKLTQTYEKMMNQTIASSNVKYSTKNDSKIDNFDFNDIIIASSGMIAKNSTSAQYIEELFKCKQPITIIRTGYMDSSEESYGYSILQEWKHHGGLLFDVSLSAHSSYEELYNLIDALKPTNIVSVHGSGIIHSHSDKVEVTTDKEKDEIHTPIMDDVFVISNSEIQSKWQRTVQIGTNALNERRLLNNVMPFNNVFATLVQSIKSDSKYHPILTIMQSLESVNHLFAFLKQTMENDFTIENFQDLIINATTNKENPPIKTNVEIHNDPVWTSDSILYIYRNAIPCQQLSHEIIPSTADFVGRNDSNIQLSVNYCKSCDKFFIDLTSFEAYQKRYGFIIGNIVLEETANTSYKELALSEASPLRLCGYSVNQQENLSRETRQYIIRKIITLDIMSKSDVIRYLEYFINMNGKRRGNQIAISKWKEDLAYTLTSNFDEQNKFNISKITRY